MVVQNGEKGTILTDKNEQILTKAQEKLDTLFMERKMPESHGMNHCNLVLGHMFQSIQASEIKLTDEKKLLLALAALLHEADDHKYFGPQSTNARDILKQVFEENDEREGLISQVEEMISYVSASVNGNSVPEKAKKDPTLLWPRFCDRLESIGVIGAVRCLQYNQEIEAPLSSETTPRPASESEVWEYVTEDRWSNYQKGGNSDSMMDHYYDKLLQIAVFTPSVVQNSYLVDEAAKRVEPLIRICLEYGKTGETPVDLIMSFKK